MDYEKLYKEALERARQVHTTNIDENKKSTEYIFPVLKESEDEKIRKSLIHLLQVGGYMSKEEKTKAFAWLEKQSKENMIEALRLEYEKGKADGLQEQRKEWTAEDLLNRNEIADILQEYNRDDLIDWLEKQGTNKPADKVEPKFHEGNWVTDGINDYLIQGKAEKSYVTKTIDGKVGCILFDNVNQFHLWSIEDAKDGDVLVSHAGQPFIFKGVLDVCNPGRPTGYCGINVIGQFNVSTTDGYWTDLCGVKPATKEQRDLLFQKMKEAGYEWDAEKKVLEKISQEYPLTPDECVKPAWSEEDEYTLYETIQHLEELIRIDKAKHCACDVQYYQRDIDWLKSLKERIKNVKNR